MQKQRFPNIEAGQEIEIDWQKNDLHLACCDCNLVHIIQFRVVGNKIIMQAYRHSRKTAALRRHRGIPIEAHLTKYAPDVASATSAEPDSGLESVPAVESDTQPRG